MCPEQGSNGSPHPGQRYFHGGAQARDTVLGSLTVSDHPLLLQTIASRGASTYLSRLTVTPPDFFQHPKVILAPDASS
jgi:hypothetical protein